MNESGRDNGDADSPLNSRQIRSWSEGIGHSFEPIRTLLPVLVVASLWIMVSVGTSLYLRWLEAEYDRVFKENLTLIQTASDLESGVWKIAGLWMDPAMSDDVLPVRLEGMLAVMTEKMQVIEQMAHTSDEQNNEAMLREKLHAIRGVMLAEMGIRQLTHERKVEAIQKLHILAEEFSVHTRAIRSVNDELIRTSRDRLAGAQGIVMSVRVILLILGPVVGIVLGWRAAKKLMSSVAEIAVTLSDAGLESEMTLSISPESSLQEVRRKAERVMSQLREAGRELQSARKEAIRSERLAAVGELAAGVAHELRNPLTSVKLLLQHAARQSRELPMSESQMTLILEEIGRMESTIQGLLDFSRTPALNRVRHDLRETLNRSLNLVDGRMRQQSIELSCAVSLEPLWMNGDAEQLNQVFVNLLLNSIEAMPDGGRLRVAARKRGDGMAEVIFTDSGDGISTEILPRLFEPFATTKERGTGLGLAVSNRIVTEHGGRIVAENIEGQGASMTVVLPLSEMDSKNLGT
ncbi:MAG: hypothetical protein JNL58_03235 [Planctomyces sp.]|nr:hypothetical protein [Planctomyces sp.]